MTRTRIHNFSISLDGFATGEGQSADAPFGHAGHRLHGWMFATRFGAQIMGREGGAAGVDDAVAQQHEPGIGAEIMGAGKFGPPGWQEDHDWKGWWGPNPPFHTPTFVLTHRPQPPIEMEGGTTFHFLDASPAEALDVARAAAGGQDVRIGGGQVNSYGRPVPSGGTLTLPDGTWGRLPDPPQLGTGGWRVQARSGRHTAIEGCLYDDTEQRWTVAPQPDGAAARPAQRSGPVTGSSSWADSPTTTTTTPTPGSADGPSSSSREDQKVRSRRFGPLCSLTALLAACGSPATECADIPGDLGVQITPRRLLVGRDGGAHGRCLHRRSLRECAVGRPGPVRCPGRSA